MTVLSIFPEEQKIIMKELKLQVQTDTAKLKIKKLFEE